MSVIEELTYKLIEFRNARGWGKDHTPRNLAISISIEAAELLEHFQWLSPCQTEPKAEHLPMSDEIADIFIYLLYLCHALGIDLSTAVNRKIERNARKYPLKH